MPKKMFGFRVAQEPNGGWSVSLPHQCDRWSITGAAIWDEGAPHEQAVVEFAHFIVQAEEAFQHLQKRQPLNDPNDDDDEEPASPADAIPATDRDRWTWRCPHCGATTKATFTTASDAELDADTKHPRCEEPSHAG